MDKSIFFGLFAVIQALTLIGLPILGLFLNRMPDELINMPNRDYWLADERREDSLAVSRLILDWTAVASAFFLAAIFQIISLVAMEVAFPVKTSLWLTIFIFFTYIAGVVAFSIWRFRLPIEIQSEH